MSAPAHFPSAPELAACLGDGAGESVVVAKARLDRGQDRGGGLLTSAACRGNEFLEARIPGWRTHAAEVGEPTPDHWTAQ